MNSQQKRLHLLAELEALIQAAPTDNYEKTRIDTIGTTASAVKLKHEEEIAALTQEMTQLQEAAKTQAAKLLKAEQTIDAQKKALQALQDRLDQASFQTADNGIAELLRLENQQMKAQKDALQKQLAAQARNFETQAAEQMRERSALESRLMEAQGEAALLRIRVDELSQRNSSNAKLGERLERMQKMAQAAMDGEARAKKKIVELEAIVQELEDEIREQGGLLLSMGSRLEKEKKTERLGSQVKMQMVIFED